MNKDIKFTSLLIKEKKNHPEVPEQSKRIVGYTKMTKGTVMKLWENKRVEGQGVHHFLNTLSIK